METLLHNITVDVLTKEDLDWYVNVASVRMLSEEVGRPELVHRETLQELAELMMETKTTFVAKRGGVPLGMVGGLLIPNLFNPNITSLCEMVWYVLPEYRNTRAALLLIDAFTECGEKLADETTFTLLHDSPVKIRTLEKRGYHLSEFAFRKQRKQ